MSEKGPGKGYGNIAGWPKLNKGNLVDVLGKEGAWYKIRIAGEMRDIFRKIICREYKKMPRSLVLWGSENIVLSYGYCDSSPLFVPFFIFLMLQSA